MTINNYNIPSLISENIGDVENFIRDKNPFYDLHTKTKLTTESKT